MKQKGCVMENKNIMRDVKAMYFAGVPQNQIMDTKGISRWQLTKMINKLVENYPQETKENRLLQAKLMESNIFDMIKKGKDVSGLVKQFSSFCA